MQEVDRFPVEGDTPLAQNGRLASRIGGKPYHIESIERDPPTPEITQGDVQVWVVLGDWH